MIITNITPLRYSPGKLEYFSFIRGDVGAQFHQGPEIYPFSDGRVLILWGAYDIQECSKDSVVLYSESDDQGITWSAPQVFLKTPGCLNSALLLQMRNTPKVLLFIRESFYVDYVEDKKHRIFTKWADYSKSYSRMILRESNDLGKTWSLGREMPFYCFEALQIESGRILVSVYSLDKSKKEQFYIAYFLYSDDEGKTWEKSNDIIMPEKRGAMEPTFVEVSPNKIYCIIRNKSGYLYESISEDGGKTWQSAKKTQIPAPESMARLLKLKSGNVLLVWNNIPSTSQHPRHPLVTSLSCDGCESWSEPKIIADDIGLNQLSNHGISQLKDGRILLGISHYYATLPSFGDLEMAIFDEEWMSSR
ncbi:MAG TPA: sialidase family protein [bacterium]|nr:sialidase family protein [bacterium]